MWPSISSLCRGPLACSDEAILFELQSGLDCRGLAWLPFTNSPMDFALRAHQAIREICIWKSGQSSNSRPTGARARWPCRNAPAGSGPGTGKYCDASTNWDGRRVYCGPASDIAMQSYSDGCVLRMVVGEWERQHVFCYILMASWLCNHCHYRPSHCFVRPLQQGFDIYSA